MHLSKRTASPPTKDIKLMPICRFSFASVTTHLQLTIYEIKFRVSSTRKIISRKLYIFLWQYFVVYDRIYRSFCEESAVIEINNRWYHYILSYLLSDDTWYWGSFGFRRLEQSLPLSILNKSYSMFLRLSLKLSVDFAGSLAVRSAIFCFLDSGVP